MFATSFVRLVIAAAVAVTMGFTWTVGQSGLHQTNTNLCDLWKSLPLPAYPSCEFQYILPVAWAFAFCAAVVWACIELFRLVGKTTKRRHRLLSYLLLSVFFVIGSFVSIGFLISEYRRPAIVAGLKDNTQATLPIAATKTEPEKPLSMRDLLSDEFPGVLRHSAELPFNFDDTAPGLSVFVVVYQDPRSGGEFLGFYVPHTAKTFDVVQNIFQRHLDVMKAVRGDGTIEIRGPGEITGLSTNNTKFSGKVYVYYETRMSLQELGKLDALAQSLGLSPAFRDTQYLLGRQQIKRDIQSHAK